MSEQIFPAEIVEFSTENHFHKNDKNFNYIYLSILLIILMFIISFPLIKIDITTQSRGIAKTKFESTTIQTGTYGLIEYSCIREGLKVAEGDTLLVLNTDNIHEEINRAKKNISHNDRFISDLDMLINKGSDVKTERYRQEYIQYQTKLHELDLKIGLQKKEYEIQEHLFNEKVIAKLEFLQNKNEYETLLAERELYVQQSLNNWQTEKANLEQENRSSYANIKKQNKDKKQYVVTSPTSGSVYQVKGIHAGSFISPGEALAQISPDKEIIAECYLSPSDIGYINLNQNVNFQIDAFNYNQWGLIKGQVLSISDDIVMYDDSPVFKVQCSLAKKYLQLKSGHKGYLKKGMTLTGRFYLNRRTLFQLLYDKMDNWLNPKIANLVQN
jgi:HlyD family secretion protein